MLLHFILGQRYGLGAASRGSNRLNQSHSFGVPVGDAHGHGSAGWHGRTLYEGRYGYRLTAGSLDCVERPGWNCDRIDANGAAVNFGYDLGIHGSCAGLDRTLDSYFFGPGCSGIKSVWDIKAICRDGIAGHTEFRT